MGRPIIRLNGRGLPTDRASLWLVMLLSAVPDSERNAVATALCPSDPGSILDQLDTPRNGVLKLAAFLALDRLPETLAAAAFALTIKASNEAGFGDLILSALGDNGDGTLDLFETYTVLEKSTTTLSVGATAARDFLKDAKSNVNFVADAIDPFLPGNQGGPGTKQYSMADAVKAIFGLIRSVI